MSLRSLWRNPYVLAFLLGIITLTAIRPLLRRVPEPPPVLSQLPAFTLVAADGNPFGSDDLKGRPYIASFFFTSCRSICPTIMKGMQRLDDGFKQRGIGEIRLVSITVDPEDDTPAVLAAYAKTLGADPQRWVLLTGEPDAVKRLVVAGFKTPLEKAPPGGPGPMDIAHTGKLVLVDGSGRIRGYYGTDDLGLDEVYNRAQHVLAQEQDAGTSR